MARLFLMGIQAIAANAQPLANDLAVFAAAQSGEHPEKATKRPLQ